MNWSKKNYKRFDLLFLSIETFQRVLKINTQLKKTTPDP